MILSSVSQRFMWWKPCHKPAKWEWFIAPINMVMTGGWCRWHNKYNYNYIYNSNYMFSPHSHDIIVLTTWSPRLGPRLDRWHLRGFALFRPRTSIERKRNTIACPKIRPAGDPQGSHGKSWGKWWVKLQWLTSGWWFQYGNQWHEMAAFSSFSHFAMKEATTFFMHLSVGTVVYASVSPTRFLYCCLLSPNGNLFR